MAAGTECYGLTSFLFPRPFQVDTWQSSKLFFNKQKIFPSFGSSNTSSTAVVVVKSFLPCVAALAEGVTAALFVSIQQQQVTGCEESRFPQKKDCYKEKIYADMRCSFVDNGNQSHYFKMAPPLPRIILSHPGNFSILNLFC